MTSTANGHILLTGALGLLLTTTGGCDGIDAIDLCGDRPTHDEQQPSCDTGGRARIQAPARLNLSEQASNVHGATCLDSNRGCTAQPFVTFSSDPSDSAGPRQRLIVQMFLPPVEGPASYTLPVPPFDGSPALRLYGHATLWPPSGTPESLDIVGGTIFVTHSNPGDLRATIALTLRLPSTGEIITLSSSDARADCHLETVTVCEGGGFM